MNKDAYDDRAWVGDLMGLTHALHEYLDMLHAVMDIDNRMERVRREGAIQQITMLMNKIQDSYRLTVECLQSEGGKSC